MPTYEYACKSCATHVEVVQSFTDDALTTCESCGGDLRKVFGAVGISFKGSGFYKNDSRPNSNPSSNPTAESAKTDAAKNDSGDGKDGKKADAAPAKTESTPKPASSDSAKAS